MIKANLSGALSANLLIPLIITFIFYDFFPLTQLYIWLILQIAVSILRIIFNKKLTETTTIHFFLLTLTSILYAILAWQTLIYSDGTHLLFVGMVISSIVAGSGTTIVSIFHIFIVFILIQMISLISAFLYMNMELFYLSAFLASAFTYIIITNGYKQFKTLNETLRLHEQVNDLLDNAGQGFLSFDKDLKCAKNFSNECNRIFRLEDIHNFDISELLFSDSISNKGLFRDGIKRTIDTTDDSIKDIFLSLLPKENIINNSPIKIECKHLPSNRFMLILTDITKTKNLKSTLEYQMKVQNMVVAVAANKNDFMEIKESFEEFMSYINEKFESTEAIINSILRELHTFKGIFSQKEMINTPEYIYELELELRENASDMEKLSHIKNSKLQEMFNKDIDIINSILGEWFLHSKKLINVNEDSIDEIEQNLALVYDTLDLNAQKILNPSITLLQKLKYRSLNRMLSPYILHVEQLSNSLEKELYPLEIIGDTNTKVAPKFRDFIKSLVHLFNNCVDHGIEDIDERAQTDKDEYGTIKCSFEIISDTLMIQISDDGRGINTSKLSAKAMEKSLKTKEELEQMSEEDKCKLIFLDTLSIKENISKLSGFGIGMNAIKEALEKLDGKFSIDNTLGKGVTFTFYIPLNSEKDKYLLNINKCVNISKIVSNQIELFLQDSLSLKIKKIEEVQNISFTNSYAQIDLYDGFDGSIIFIFSKEMMQIMKSKLIPKDFNSADIEWMTQELPDEVTNTIVGLSLQYLTKDFGTIRISPPVHLDVFHLIKTLEDSNNKFMQDIQSDIGKITMITITKEAH